MALLSSLQTEITLKPQIKKISLWALLSLLPILAFGANTLSTRTEATSVAETDILYLSDSAGGIPDWKLPFSVLRTELLDTPSGDLTISAAGVTGITLDDDGNHIINSLLDAATGDEAALSLNYTTNKASGPDTGLVINQTDTASPGTSLLADFQVGGVSKV